MKYLHRIYEGQLFQPGINVWWKRYYGSYQTFNGVPDINRHLSFGITIAWTRR
jgi:hypothetical protein